MGYTLLEVENIPEALRNKPRWVVCVAFTTAILMIVTSAISVGVLIGYTYCYFEHRSGNVTANFQIIHLPHNDSEEPVANRTINGALISSVLISKILRMGQVLMEEELSYMPWSNEDSNMAHPYT